MPEIVGLWAAGGFCVCVRLGTSKNWKSVIQGCNPSKVKHQESWRIVTVLHGSCDYLGYSAAPFPNQARLWSLGYGRKGLSCGCKRDDSGLCSCCVRVKAAEDEDCQPALVV